jgi:hypothetical protein
VTELSFHIDDPVRRHQIIVAAALLGLKIDFGPDPNQFRVIVRDVEEAYQFGLLSNSSLAAAEAAAL